jgi:hypothetical protein
LLIGQESEDSTWGAYKRDLLPVSGLKEEQFLLVNTSLDPDLAAAQYQGGNGILFTLRIFLELMNWISFAM